MRFIKVSERLPELKDKKAFPVFVKHMKPRYKNSSYEAKATAYYFPDRFKTVEWEDWDDYHEEDFPYTENDADSGCVWLRAGWYTSIECDKCDGYWSRPLDVIGWYEEPDESTPPASVEEAAKIAGHYTALRYKTPSQEDGISDHEFYNGLLDAIMESAGHATEQQSQEIKELREGIQTVIDLGYHSQLLIDLLNKYK